MHLTYTGRPTNLSNLQSLFAWPSSSDELQIQRLGDRTQINI